MGDPIGFDPQWQKLINEALPQKPQLALRLSIGPDSQPYLTIRACLRCSPERTLELQLSKLLAQHFQPFESHRVYSCLKSWIPWLLKLQRQIKADFSIALSMCDGGEAGVASMDSANADFLIPDLYSMQAARQLQKYGKPLPFQRFLNRWQQKAPVLFWRGGTTGIQSDGPINSISSLIANPRVKICLEQRDKPACDIKISRIVQTAPEFAAMAQAWMEEQGIFAPVVQEASFSSYRFYPDIPGNALAWGTIFKHLRGCLILRPATERTLYYYRLMQPWKHYIPVKSDFSDLDNAIDWCQANPEEAAWIAWRGHQIAHRYLRQIGSHFCASAMTHSQPLARLEGL